MMLAAVEKFGLHQETAKKVSRNTELSSKTPLLPITISNQSQQMASASLGRRNFYF
jgi:hypothetical protein